MGGEMNTKDMRDWVEKVYGPKIAKEFKKMCKENTTWAEDQPNISYCFTWNDSKYGFSFWNEVNRVFVGPNLT
jgi:hypothetical protein